MKKTIAVLFGAMLIALSIQVAPAAATPPSPSVTPSVSSSVSPTPEVSVSPNVSPTVTATTQAPSATPTKAADCAAYLYAGTKQNLCDRFAKPNGKVNCKQVGYKVKLVDAKKDPWGLDGSGANIGTVGVGCESYPERVIPKSPGPSPSKTVAAGGLPQTGAPTYLVAGTGLFLLVAGAVALVLTRKRRVRVEAE